MLQVQTLPASLAGMLWTFRWCFTEPSYRTFTALLAGMVAQPGRRTVCGMLTGAGLSRRRRSVASSHPITAIRHCRARPEALRF